MLTARNEEKLKEVVGKIKGNGGNAIGVVADTKSTADTKRVFEETIKILGQSFFSWDCHHIVYWLVTQPLTGWKSNAVRLLPTAKNSRTI